MRNLVIATSCVLSLYLPIAVSHSRGQTPQANEHANHSLQLAQAGDLKGAEAELRRAVEFSPNDVSCLAALGGILGMQHRLEEANSYFEKALTLDPDNIVIRRNLATNQWKLGRFHEAKNNLQLILKERAADKFSTWLLGM